MNITASDVVGEPEAAEREVEEDGHTQLQTTHEEVEAMNISAFEACGEQDATGRESANHLHTKQIESATKEGTEDDLHVDFVEHEVEMNVSVSEEIDEAEPAEDDLHAKQTVCTAQQKKLDAQPDRDMNIAEDVAPADEVDISVSRPMDAAVAPSAASTNAAPQSQDEKAVPGMKTSTASATRTEYNGTPRRRSMSKNCIGWLYASM
eukprot:4450128-Amphidinium_carterae.1